MRKLEINKKEKKNVGAEKYRDKKGTWEINDDEK